MNSGRKGLTVKWLGGIMGILFIGAGNIVGAMAHRLAVEGGMLWESAGLLRWLVTGGLWAVGVALAAVLYALGAAMEKIGVLESWIVSMDTAIRNQKQEE